MVYKAFIQRNKVAKVTRQGKDISHKEQDTNTIVKHLHGIGNHHDPHSTRCFGVYHLCKVGVLAS